MFWKKAQTMRVNVKLQNKHRMIELAVLELPKKLAVQVLQGQTTILGSLFQYLTTLTVFFPSIPFPCSSLCFLSFILLLCTSTQSCFKHLLCILPSYFSPMYSISYKCGNKETVGDGVKDLPSVKIQNMQCSPLVHSVSHPTESNGLSQA